MWEGMIDTLVRRRGCRKIGIKKWPHRKIKMLERCRAINTRKEGGSNDQLQVVQYCSTTCLSLQPSGLGTRAKRYRWSLRLVGGDLSMIKEIVAVLMYILQSRNVNSMLDSDDNSSICPSEMSQVLINRRALLS